MTSPARTARDCIDDLYRKLDDDFHLSITRHPAWDTVIIAIVDAFADGRRAGEPPEAQPAARVVPERPRDDGTIRRAGQYERKE